MKRLLVIYEGVADGSLKELEGCTPLELARNNNASVLVSRGNSGLLDWTGDDVSGRMEYKLASLLGINHQVARSLRRGPVEAAGTDIPPGAWTYAYRGNFVPVDEGRMQEDRVSNLTMDETQWLTESLQEAVRPQNILLRVLGDARIAVMYDQLDGRIDAGENPRAGAWVDVADASRLSGKKKSSSERDSFMMHSIKALSDSTLNDVRIDLGENPANMVWLWGGGPPVDVGRAFLGAPLQAAMITNSPLAKGMAKVCGMDWMALGDLWRNDLNPHMIDAYALNKCINHHELTVIYVESPREGGSFGSAVEKVKGIDRMDIHVLGTVLKVVNDLADARVLITALPEEDVVMDATPFLMCGKGVSRDQVSVWNEQSCEEGSLGFVPAERCLTKLIGE